MRRVSSRQNAVVETFRAAARGDGPQLLLDGEHLVEEAFAAGCRITHLSISAERASESRVADLVRRAEAAGVDVIDATGPVMHAVSPVRSSSALVALAERPDRRADLFAGTWPFVIIACDIQDPGNVGAMIRVAEGAGASGFIAAGHCADPFGWKALRGSMGSALRLPVQVTSTVDAAVAEARRHGCRIVATIPRGGTPFFEANLTRPTALLIGGEGRGLDAAILTLADERLTIPMAAPVESLNAAVAAALIAYEGRRQRS